jgi:anti-anti-sigma factor
VTTFDLVEREHADPSVRLVEVSGEIDLTNTHSLEARLEDVPKELVLVLDLNRVVFMDSAALHSLFRLCRARGRERFGLVVERTAAIARTLEIVGVRDALAVGTSADEVLAAVATRG